MSKPDPVLSNVHFEFTVKVNDQTVKFIYDEQKLVTLDEGNALRTLTFKDVAVLDFILAEAFDTALGTIIDFNRGLLGERTGPPPGTPKT